MNRGEFQSSLVQQMMMSNGGSPSPCPNNGWWSSDNMSSSASTSSSLRQPTSCDEQQEASPNLPSLSSPSVLFSQFPAHQSSGFVNPMAATPPPSLHADGQEMPESWSQLLLGGLVGDERYNTTALLSKRIENWEDQVAQPSAACMVGVKQEGSHGAFFYGHGSDQDIHGAKSQLNQMLLASSSPRSCITTSLGSNMLDFSKSMPDLRNHYSDNSSECNSTATGSALKKARVQASSSAQSTLKVRKERLGDRITALHQIVSPFGKTDTASVLQETIGYIRFLLGQIEALSYPYLGQGSGNSMQTGQGERNSCLFPEYPGQLLNHKNNANAKGGQPEQGGNDEPKKDLRSRGLCLVPVSCTSHFGGDNGADYWAPALGGVLR